jgi:hypothetical protein
LVLGTMAAAEAVSKRHPARFRNAADDDPARATTTMRDMPPPDALAPWPAAVTALNTFYAVSQVLATMNILWPSDRPIDAAFVVLFPIQLAAFLLTCVRKGVIGSDAWHLLYAASLLLAYAHVYIYIHHPYRLEYLAVAGCVCALRLGARVNRYAVWTGAALCTALLESTLRFA